MNSRHLAGTVTAFVLLLAAPASARVIQAEVRDRLTDEILFGALENGGTVTLDYDGTALTFAFAPTRT